MPPVPAKRFVPETESARTGPFGKPAFAEVQLAPLLVERKTLPLWVPAKRFVLTMAKDQTVGPVKPVLATAQSVPLFVDTKTPSPVPAKILLPITAKELTPRAGPGGRPELTAVQLVPVFVERRTPPWIPAKRFVPLAEREYTTSCVKMVATQRVLPSVERKIPS